MSNRTSREIECISRLDSFIASLETMQDFLQGEGLLSKDDRRAGAMTDDKAKWLWNYLNRLSKDNKIQLLEYCWELLPVERLKITVVTDRNSREFSYNY